VIFRGNPSVMFERVGPVPKPAAAYGSRLVKSAK
jgi:hypothetical protein